MQEEIVLDNDIIKNPYNTIIDWAEQRLKIFGRKTFHVLALQPISLFAPRIPYVDETIMANMHSLILSPSGSGKSMVIKSFKEITYNPFDFLKISGPKFTEEIYGTDNVSLLCGDVLSIFSNPDFMKDLEGITGDERISRQNMRRERDADVNAIFVGAGLPSSLTKYFAFGMLRRLIPMVIFYNEEEDEQIEEHISKSVFKKGAKISSEQVKAYYQKIFNIQRGKDDSFPKIDGYYVKPRFIEEITDTHRYNKRAYSFPPDVYLYTELFSGYRYMCNSAILNMFNRKIEEENGKRLIVPDEKDCELAKQLLTQEMEMKSDVWVMDTMVRNNKDILGLYKRIINSEKLDDTQKKLAEIFINQKMGGKKKGG